MKDNQHEQLFTELTPAEAAVIEGGVTVVDRPVNFDRALYVPKQSSPSFRVPNGHSVILTTQTSGGDGQFSAQLIKDGPDFGRPTQTVSTGRDVTTWARQPGGNYRIFLSDNQDGRFVTGNVKVDVVPG